MAGVKTVQSYLREKCEAYENEIECLRKEIKLLREKNARLSGYISEKEKELSNFYWEKSPGQGG